MSSIVGVVALDGRAVPPSTVEQMARALPEFGPDGIHVCTGETWGLGFVGLQTTPEEVGEVQPITVPDRNLIVLFSGRLDERRDLRRHLGPDAVLGHDASDARLALAAYERFGEQCVSHLYGDFDLAVFNTRSHRLFLARSPVDTRSFLWWCDGRTFAFASEARQLFAVPGIEASPNEPLLCEMLARTWVTPDETLWRNVYRLVPGRALTVHLGPPRVWRWFEGPFPQVTFSSESDYADRFNELFDAALVSRFRSTTDVALLFSGGLDSSAIACRAAELQRAGRIDRTPRLLSVRFPGRPHDESEWRRIVADHAGLAVEDRDPASYDWERSRAWSRRTLHLPPRPPTHSLLQFMPAMQDQGIRVVLTGEGGDNWLNGNQAYFGDLLRRGEWGTLLRDWWVTPADRGFLRRVWPLVKWGRGPIGSARYRADYFTPHLGTVRGPIAPWINPDWAAATGLAARQVREPDTPALDRLSQRRLYQNYVEARSAQNLHYVTSFAAMHAIDLRHPFYDRRLTEFVMGVPGRILGPPKKALLRHAMRHTLPPRLQGRTDKSNMRDELTHTIEAFLAHHGPLDGLQCVKNGWVDGRRLWDLHVKSARTDGAVITALWLVISLEVWLTEAVPSARQCASHSG